MKIILDTEQNEKLKTLVDTFKKVEMGMEDGVELGYTQISRILNDIIGVVPLDEDFIEEVLVRSEMNYAVRNFTIEEQQRILTKDQNETDVVFEREIQEPVIINHESARYGNELIKTIKDYADKKNISLTENDWKVFIDFSIGYIRYMDKDIVQEIFEMCADEIGGDKFKPVFENSK